MTGPGTSPPSPPETDPPPPEADASSPEADAFSPEADAWLYVGAGVLIGIVVLGALALVFIDTVRAGWWAFLTYNEQGSSTSELVQRWGVIFAALFAGGIAIWRAVIADRARATAEKEHLRQIRAGELSDQREVQRQDFEQYQQAALGLTNESEGVRVASAISLKALVSDRDPVLNDRIASLCEAMLRDWRGIGKSEELEHCGPVENATVEAAIAARAQCTPDRQSANLSRLDLRGAEFAGIDFGPAELFDSDLTGVRFSSCILEEGALMGCMLTSIEASDTRFFFKSWPRTDLRHSQFDACRISMHLAPLDLSETEIYGCSFVADVKTCVDITNAYIDPFTKVGPGPGVEFQAWADRGPRLNRNDDIARKLKLMPSYQRRDRESVLDYRFRDVPVLIKTKAEAALRDREDDQS